MTRRTSFCLLALAAAFVLGVFARPIFSEIRAHVLARAPDAAPYDQLRYARRNFQFAQLKPRRIIFLGDSRIEQGEWSELLDRCDISNRGIEGDTTKGILDRLDSSVPQDGLTCVLQAGINDLSKGSSVDALVSNYRAMLQYLIGQKHAHVVITATIFAGRDYAQLNARIAESNQALAQLTASTGAVWLDVNAALCPAGFLSSDYSNDGVHLNGQAYRRLATLLAPLLESSASS